MLNFSFAECGFRYENHNGQNEKEKERNSHIDYSHSHENKYLVQESLKGLYERKFGEALEKYNLKRKRSDRKIDNYYNHVQSSKKRLCNRK